MAAAAARRRSRRDGVGGGGGGGGYGCTTGRGARTRPIARSVAWSRSRATTSSSSSSRAMMTRARSRRRGGAAAAAARRRSRRDGGCGGGGGGATGRGARTRPIARSVARSRSRATTPSSSSSRTVMTRARSRRGGGAAAAAARRRSRRDGGGGGDGGGYGGTTGRGARTRPINRSVARSLQHLTTVLCHSRPWDVARAPIERVVRAHGVGIYCRFRCAWSSTISGGTRVHRTESRGCRPDTTVRMAHGTAPVARP